VDANVFIHFDFDKYQPDFIPKGELPGVFSLFRMIPPGNHKFFFTIEGNFALSSSHRKLALDVLSFIFLKDHLEFYYPDAVE
jgi:hypothetical protein